jgi:apolipoprotein N-acyltransferase
MTRVEPIARAPHGTVQRTQNGRFHASSVGASLESTPTTRTKLLLSAAVAAGAFHIAWSVPALSAFACIYAWALILISAASSPALSFRFGFLAGFLVFAPQLAWFWNIFGIVSVCLWAVLSFFTALFTLLLHRWRRRFRSQYLWIAAPIVWTGIEFFRSELYLLKFSWLSVGYLFSEGTGILPMGALGVYGTGFAVFLLSGAFLNRSIHLKVTLVLVLTLFLNWPTQTGNFSTGSSVKVAGIQLEFPPDLEVPGYLDRVLATHPDAQILVLSEYAFDGSVPKHVRDWCRHHGKYLIAGGKEEVFEAGKNNFRNTAFVIGPTGEIIFQQGKSVPIQFFSDGLPAKDQKLWNSPWGRIAIPTCYDLSYRRVTDRFAAAGAEAFIVPFMDVADWGEHQHRQHTRIALVRAREYRLAIFRLGSSGISQHVDPHGNLLAQGSFPGQEEIIGGMLHMEKARLPLDYWIAPACSVLAALAAFLLVCEALRNHYITRIMDR